MVIALILQYLQNSFPWENSELINNTIIIKTNLAILLFIIIYILFKNIWCERFKNKKRRYRKFNNIDLIMNLSFIFSILCSLSIIYMTGFFNLFARSSNVVNIGSSALALIIENTFRAFPVISFAIHYIYKDINNKYYSKLQIIIIIFFGIMVNFPTGLPRFQMAAVYLGCFLIIKKKFKSKIIFKYMIIFGLLFIFPLINIFRHNTFADLVNLNISMPNPTEDFIKGDFDSYSMLARSFIYTKLYGITWGRQLFGSVLFFIPRSIWNSKAIGSGATIGESFGWTFTNVSCPYIGEAVINFGWIGIIVFAIALAYFIIKLSCSYEKLLNIDYEEVTLIRVIYPFIIGFVFFIMRGDLLSSLAFTVGFCIPAIVLYVIDSLLTKLKF